MAVASRDDLVVGATYHGVQHHKNGPSQEFEGVHTGAYLNRAKIRKKYKDNSIKDRYGLLVPDVKLGKTIRFFDLDDLTLISEPGDDNGEEA